MLHFWCSCFVVNFFYLVRSLKVWCPWKASYLANQHAKMCNFCFVFVFCILLLLGVCGCLVNQYVSELSPPCSKLPNLDSNYNAPVKGLQPPVLRLFLIFHFVGRLLFLKIVCPAKSFCLPSPRNDNASLNTLDSCTGTDLEGTGRSLMFMFLTMLGGGGR